jgi:nitrite reductase/ring-hydroxylating ferredoxin subunit
MSIDVGPVEKFSDGRMSVVRAGRLEIGIIRWSGAVYAISNVCTHQGGPLCHGVLAARLTAERPGDMQVGETLVIACPWHGWEFDIASGEAIWDPTKRIRTFPVHIANGRVMVQTDASQGRSNDNE